MNGFIIMHGTISAPLYSNVLSKVLEVPLHRRQLDYYTCFTTYATHNPV